MDDGDGMEDVNGVENVLGFEGKHVGYGKEGARGLKDEWHDHVAITLQGYAMMNGQPDKWSADMLRDVNVQLQVKEGSQGWKLGLMDNLSKCPPPDYTGVSINLCVWKVRSMQ